MCLAPRYINGMMARPSSPCRYTASLPETPCALRVAPAANTAASATSVWIERRLIPRISFMAVVTGLVDFVADLQNPIGAMPLGGLQRLGRCRGHRLGHLRPVFSVNCAPVGEQHAGRIRQHRRARRHARPLFV